MSGCISIGRAARSLGNTGYEDTLPTVSSHIWTISSTTRRIPNTTRVIEMKSNKVQDTMSRTIKDEAKEMILYPD